MQTQVEINNKRAQVYWWFSSLFAKELTDQQIEALNSDDGRVFLQGFSEIESMNSSIELFKEKLQLVLKREDAQLELAADFAQAFLASHHTSALPFASVYMNEKGLLMQEPTHRMEKWLAEQNMQLASEAEAPDHLALELDFLGNLAIKQAEHKTGSDKKRYQQLQLTFIQQELEFWINKWQEKLQKSDTFGFYAAIGEMLTAFIKEDKQWLEGSE